MKMNIFAFIFARLFTQTHRVYNLYHKFGTKVDLVSILVEDQESKESVRRSFSELD